MDPKAVKYHGSTVKKYGSYGCPTARNLLEVQSESVSGRLDKEALTALLQVLGRCYKIDFSSLMISCCFLLY
jgi:hypothetical protein